jgi:hypothetical protein
VANPVIYAILRRRRRRRRHYPLVMIPPFMSVLD